MASPTIAAQPTPLAERVEVHKSCKSLEGLVRALNDYSEAAAAVVTTQKKLAKALRETAALKITGSIATNAFNASASIFDILSDIDGKFAKYTDREHNDISTEVRKWIRKLSKEEKAHDDRLSSANARIKQAGQLFEKKSKKHARDADEEHARYINLISTLGPEISQEKHKHALLVTQRHTTTTYSVAACISRVADAEWSRVCEGVRRFGPTVGTLGQWRVLCEGGWMGSVPEDLPIEEDGSKHTQGPEESDEEFDAKRYTTLNARPKENRESGESLPVGKPEKKDEATSDLAAPRDRPVASGSNDTPRPQANVPVERVSQDRYISRPNSIPVSPSMTSAPTELLHSTRSDSLQEQPPPPHNPITPSKSSSEHPRTLLAAPKDNVDNFGSLSSFPAPPTHFPIPPLASVSGPHRPRLPSLSQSQSAPSQPNTSRPRLPSLSQSQSASSSQASYSVLSPKGAPPVEASGSPSTSHSPSDLRESPLDQTGIGSGFGRVNDLAYGGMMQSPTEVQRSLPSPPPRPLLDAAPSLAKGIYLHDDREFGVSRHEAESRHAFGVQYPRASTMNAALRSSAAPSVIERTESVTTNTTGGSIVAAMRNRYSHPAGAPSPPPRDVPRLPLSVSNLASRYQPIESEQDREHPLSPRRRTTSPPVIDRQMTPFDPDAPTRAWASPTNGTEDVREEHEDTPHYNQRHQQQEQALAVPLNNSPSRKALTASPVSFVGEGGRERRYDDSADRDPWMDREAGLRARERELERERARLLTVRANAGHDDDEDRYTRRDGSGMRSSAHLHVSQQKVEFPSSSSPSSSSPGRLIPRGGGAYSYSTTHLVPPPSPHAASHSSRSRPASPGYESSTAHSGAKDHADFCGCHVCSVSKYKTSSSPPCAPSSPSLRPPMDGAATPRQQGGGGKGAGGTAKAWMRRLSMPVSVGNAFSLDSKKGASSRTVASTAVREDGRLRGSLDVGNRSVANLVRR